MRLKIIQFYLPQFIKRRKLRELFLLTADAFGSAAPSLKGVSFEEMLTAYALFTREQADYYLQSERPLDEVSEQLFQNSFHWGQALRKLIGVKTWDEAMATLQVIYQVIGIDFHCDETGHVCVQRCFFHQYYTKEVCQLIAALDSGVAAGLAGGSNLIFTQRITEGYQCCKGVLSR